MRAFPDSTLHRPGNIIKSIASKSHQTFLQFGACHFAVVIFIYQTSQQITVCRQGHLELIQQLTCKNRLEESAILMLVQMIRKSFGGRIIDLCHLLFQQIKLELFLLRSGWRKLAGQLHDAFADHPSDQIQQGKVRQTNENHQIGGPKFGIRQHGATDGWPTFH